MYQAHNFKLWQKINLFRAKCVFFFHVWQAIRRNINFICCKITYDKYEVLVQLITPSERSVTRGERTTPSPTTPKRVELLRSSWGGDQHFLAPSCASLTRGYPHVSTSYLPCELYRKYFFRNIKMFYFPKKSLHLHFNY